MPAAPLVAQILEAHDAVSSPKAVSDLLGDGFLLAHSRAYRTVRQLAKLADVRLTQSPPFDYGLKLLALDEVCARRVVPYVDTVSPLRALERRAPRRFTLAEVVELGLASNVVMHESMHCVVRSVTQRTFGDSALDPTRQRLLDLLLEESCADATERLCICEAGPPLFDDFVALNGHQSARRLPGVLEALGLQNVLLVTIVGFLCANFLYKSIPDANVFSLLRRVLPKATVARLPRRQVLQLFRECLEMSPGFRVKTTGAQLKVMGFDESIFELLDFDFTDELAPGRRSRLVLDAVVALVLEGPASPSATLLRSVTSASSPARPGRAPSPRRRPRRGH